MKNLIYYLVIGLFLMGCNSTKISTKKDIGFFITQTITPPQEPNMIRSGARARSKVVRYKITITDRGFRTYLNARVNNNRYPQSYYEIQNLIYVKNWNSANLSNRIEYYQNIDYGFQVNYKLYNYFKYLEYKQNQESNQSKLQK